VGCLFLWVRVGILRLVSTNNQPKRQTMNSEIKTIAIVLAVLAVVYRVDGARRLLTNGF
jgi:hypothetical protein